jgi:hypothetical protein
VKVLFSTILRAGPLAEGGEVVLLDWPSKTVLARSPVVPRDPSLQDVNPRGNGRGGRGISVTPDNVYVASFDKIDVLDHELQIQRSVSNGLVVGVHEVLMTSPDSLWLAATAIDAALEIDLLDGSIRRSFWPREMPEFQSSLGLFPSDIDKSADQRTVFLLSKDGPQARESHSMRGAHLHLNALALYKGELLALFNRKGAIVNLDRGTVVVQDDRLRGGHNLLVLDDHVVTNATRSESVHVYDLRDGQLVRSFPLRSYAWVRDATRPSPVDQGKRWLRRVARRPALANPLFVRGLEKVDNQLFVGLSPASVVCLDFETGELVDAFQYSRDVKVCVHGLRADLPETGQA